MRAEDEIFKCILHRKELSMVLTARFRWDGLQIDISRFHQSGQSSSGWSGVFDLENKREQGLSDDDFEVDSKAMERDETFGWKFLSQRTVRFDIKSFVTLLVIPAESQK